MAINFSHVQTVVMVAGVVAVDIVLFFYAKKKIKFKKDRKLNSDDNNKHGR